MISRVTNGAGLLCRTLESLGVKVVFGLPGTQNILLYEALHRSAIRPVLATHELGASFMANGYYRASGKVAPLVTIPGPGFTYALTGLAEAMQDSAAVLHIVGQPAAKGGKQFEFQALDQGGVAAPLVKRVYSIEQVDEIPEKVAEAYCLALSGEPGPVLLQWSKDSLAGVPTRPFDQSFPGLGNGALPDDSIIDKDSGSSHYYGCRLSGPP
jgi:acetolactate synthase-1/2/3 large subunit